MLCVYINISTFDLSDNYNFAAAASAAPATPSADSSVSNGVYVPAGITNGDVKPAVSTTPLADFLMQLEDYTPTVNLSPLPLS